jgi:hypothetical protein
LQNLSETFECWCRFNVLHKETGEILLEKDYGEGLYYDANGPVRGGTPLISEKPIDAETGLPA